LGRLNASCPLSTASSIVNSGMVEKTSAQVAAESTPSAWFSSTISTANWHTPSPASTAASFRAKRVRVRARMPSQAGPISTHRPIR
jgi:hypothetical protein